MRRLEGNGRASIHLDASLPSRLRSVDVPWGDEKLVDKFRFRDVGVQVVRVMRDTSKDKEGAPGGVMFESAPKIELLDPSSSDDDRKLTVHLASVPKPAWARDPLDPPVTTCAVPNCTCHNLPASTGMVYVLLPPNHTWSAPEVLTWVWPFVKMRVPVTYVITDGSDWTEEGLPVHPRTAMLTLWDRKAQFGRAEGERLATKLSAEDDDSVRPLLKPLLDAQRQLSGSATTTASGESRDSDEAELRTAKAQLLARVQNHIASIQTQPDFITIREYRSRFGADSVTLPGEEGYHGAQILAATKACSSLQLIESNIVVV
jgi:hypothetical protein